MATHANQTSATVLASHTLQLALWAILISKGVVTYDEAMVSVDTFLLGLERQQNAPGIDSAIVEMARTILLDAVESLGR